MGSTTGTMNGKVVIVTGATNGIGAETAKVLAQMGAEVVLISRSMDRLNVTAQAIRAQTGREDGAVIQADLSSLDGIRKAAAEFLQQYDRLDVLVNNAGGIFYERTLSADGYEMTFALNHLNYFLLTHLLLGVLKRTAADHGEARIVNVSSGAHQGGRVIWDDLQRERSYNSFGAYAQSKLMNILFTYELARRLEGTGVTANALHPGFVATGFNQQAKGLIGGMVKILEGVFALSPEEGAQTSIYLASSPDVQGINGKYWDRKKPVSSNAASYDQQAQRRLWDISEELSGLREAVAI